MDINEIYETLKKDGYCKNATRFSNDYLGMENGYHGHIRAGKRTIHVEALMNLYFSTQKVANSIIITKDSNSVDHSKKYKLNKITERIFEEVRRRCT